MRVAGMAFEDFRGLLFIVQRAMKWSHDGAGGLDRPFDLLYPAACVA
ncbi:MAG: hypothetical protein WD534_06915 [Phycisphaeraceae bacterium]